MARRKTVLICILSSLGALLVASLILISIYFCSPEIIFVVPDEVPSVYYNKLYHYRTGFPSYRSKIVKYSVAENYIAKHKPDMAVYFPSLLPVSSQDGKTKTKNITWSISRAGYIKEDDQSVTGESFKDILDVASVINEADPWYFDEVGEESAYDEMSEGLLEERNQVLSIFDASIEINEEDMWLGLLTDLSGNTAFVYYGENEEAHAIYEKLKETDSTIYDFKLNRSVNDATNITYKAHLDEDGIVNLIMQSGAEGVRLFRYNPEMSAYFSFLDAPALNKAKNAYGLYARFDKAIKAFLKDDALSEVELSFEVRPVF